MAVELGEIGDEKRCDYTVHANGDWGDYRCELVVGHPGPHAIGLRQHAVPLLNAIVLLTVDCDESRIALGKRAVSTVMKLLTAQRLNAASMQMPPSNSRWRSWRRNCTLFWTLLSLGDKLSAMKMTTITFALLS